MWEIIISPVSFYFLLSLFAIGAFGSLFYRKNEVLANIWSNFFAVTASCWGLIFSGFLLITRRSLSFSGGKSFFSFFELSFHVDLLTAFFIFTISLVSLFCSLYGFGYLKHFYKKYKISSFGFFYNLFIGSLILVVSAWNGVFFLVAWEIMSISSYFLVVYDRNNPSNIKAGFLYLTMTVMGTASIIFAFLLLYKYTGSFDFGLIKSSISVIPSWAKNMVFVSTLVGFGVKAGIIPLHIWLPEAHPAAPSQVSGIMSGVMIKIGIYMMMRLFLDILQPIPLWWGIVVLLIGSISALLGVLHALTEHDIKRLLAYHSIENIGIILLGFGSALTFYALGLPALALLGLISSLFHTINHAIFKSLLFLSAGSVINEMHTRNMEEYGGLIKYMPQTALFFLIGSMAISALPPFNGFWSEWLTFQTLFQGIAQLQGSVRWVFIMAAGSLAFTGGLALACFVKAFGAIFLGRPRSLEVAQAKESVFSMRIGMGMLALLSIIFGLFSGAITHILEYIGQDLSIFQDTASFVSASSSWGIQTGVVFASASAPLIFALFAGVLLMVVYMMYFVINKKQKIEKDITWNCGTSITPRMEITATGFALSIITVFKGILKPSIQQNIEYYDADSRYLSKTKTVKASVSNVYHSYFYQPFLAVISVISLKIKNVQSGNINLYISYIFVALIIALFLVLQI